MLLLICSLVLFMLFGVPIAYSMGLSGLLYFLTYHPELIAVLPARVYAGMNSSVMLSLPLFIVMGHLMNHGGLTARLIDFCMMFVGRLRGGLGLVSVMTSMVFGGISGSSVSDAASIGQVMIPAMRNKGYPVRTATGLIAASSTMGMIIPPSIPMVIYAFAASESVGRLFLGSLFAGVMVGVFMMGIVLVLARRNDYPCEEVDLSMSNVMRCTMEGVPALFMPLIVVGSVVTGIATATESAAVGALYALIVGLFIYRGITIADLPKLFGEAILSSANVMVIIAFSGVFTWILALEHVTQTIGLLFMDLQLGPQSALLVVAVIILLIGFFVDVSPAILLLTPVFLPALKLLGVSPIQFGAVLISGLAVGLVTPPVGMCLNVCASVSGESILSVFRGALPFLLANFLVLVLLSLFPVLSVWLPSVLMGS
ncbi:TRAP transporter large permease [uncultured Cohaesibacter sp.]|uniref:TRAP transporter large permease n=1 Tax=uncultured Cohaesibacter sp. TaxID=1002546 RepID=UPI0029C7C3B9|nr:TRAP transporter large permease [uncultured Cohaesibacter sp.]